LRERNFELCARILNYSDRSNSNGNTLWKQH
jgi:hypothetical protein